MRDNSKNIIMHVCTPSSDYSTSLTALTTFGVFLPGYWQHFGTENAPNLLHLHGSEFVFLSAFGHEIRSSGKSANMARNTMLISTKAFTIMAPGPFVNSPWSIFHFANATNSSSEIFDSW